MTSANALGYGSPVFVKDNHPHDDGKHHSSHMAMMMIVAIIFIIFIIFAIIIFAAMFRRDHKDGVGGMEAVAPVLAARAMDGYGGGHGRDDYKMWDHSRDDLKEFGNVREEIKTTGWTLSREQERHAWQTEKSIDGVKGEIAASERRIMDRLAYDREKRLEDEIAQSRLNQWGERLLCPRPMYAYGPPPPIEPRRYGDGYGYPAYA